MLLTKQAISDKALEIYQKLIKDSRIPEDITSEIYYLFIKRMNKYRKGHPGVSIVRSGFVSGAVKYIIRDLTRKQRTSEKREEVLFDIKQDLETICDQQPSRDNKSRILKRIFDFIKDFCGQGSSYKDYTAFFLLYYSVYFPIDFIEYVGKYLDFCPCQWRTQIRELRSRAIELCSKKLATSQASLGSAFFRILACHQEMKSITSISMKAQLLEKLKSLEINRDIVLRKFNAIKIIPRYQDAADICGVHVERFRYGINLFSRMLNTYVNSRFPGKDKAA